ncbi:hypothetical protein AAVH_19392, partial [Aphelenchoides avenae]
LKKSLPNKITPICVADAFEEYGSIGLVVGWGRDPLNLESVSDGDSDLSDLLHETFVAIYSKKKCEKNLVGLGPGYDSKYRICAGGSNRGITL